MWTHEKEETQIAGADMICRRMTGVTPYERIYGNEFVGADEVHPCKCVHGNAS